MSKSPRAGEDAFPWGADGNIVWQRGFGDGPAGEAAPPAKIDGRVARSKRTRAAVMDALIALLEEGNFKPPAKVIAERSGVSTRSVFQHFPDLETLFTAAVAYGVERYSPMVLPIVADQPLKARINALVRQRFALFEKGAMSIGRGRSSPPCRTPCARPFPASNMRFGCRSKWLSSPNWPPSGNPSGMPGWRGWRRSAASMPGMRCAGSRGWARRRPRPPWSMPSRPCCQNDTIRRSNWYERQNKQLSRATGWCKIVDVAFIAA